MIPHHFFVYNVYNVNEIHKAICIENRFYFGNRMSEKSGGG